MKVFLVANLYNREREEKDFLIIAQTKKEALIHFDNSFKDDSSSIYLLKDFKELKVKDFSVRSIDIMPYNKEYSFADCFNIGLTITFYEYVPYNTYHIVETENTVKILIKTFKEQNKDFLNGIF